MTRRGETMDAETPNLNHLTLFRRLQLCTGRPPTEEIDILRSKIDRHLTKFQNLIDPIGMVRMTVCEANSYEAQMARRQHIDDRRRIVRRVDEHRLSAVMDHIALHAIATD